jgi:hypothetical protein
MQVLERFMAYAQDFERTYSDDDWSRLAQYFAPNATYEVRHPLTPCLLRGRDAIFHGIKKSLDGFDRKFVTREIGLASPPTVAGDTLTLDWTGTYARPGTPPLTIRGRSTARYADDVIVSLVDAYEADPAAAAWFAAHGAGVDGSYA